MTCGSKGDPMINWESICLVSSVRKLPLSIFVVGVLLFISCENRMEDIDRIANIPEEEAVDISKNVEIIYSDSAQVKAVLTGPEMHIYHDSTQNYEFPKGVKLIFYDENLKETQRITSDYAIQRTKEELTEFRKNVVVNMADGSVIETEELFYDEANKRYYNTIPVVFFLSDSRGNLQATSFESDLNFQRIVGQSMTGYIVPRSNSGFPMGF